MEELKQIPQKLIMIADDNILGYGEEEIQWVYSFFSETLQEGSVAQALSRLVPIYPKSFLPVFHELARPTRITDPKKVLFGRTRGVLTVQVGRRVNENGDLFGLIDMCQLIDGRRQDRPGQTFGIRDENLDAVQQFGEVEPQIRSIDDEDSLELPLVDKRICLPSARKT